MTSKINSWQMFADHKRILNAFDAGLHIQAALEPRDEKYELNLFTNRAGVTFHFILHGYREGESKSIQMVTQVKSDSFHQHQIDFLIQDITLVSETSSLLQEDRESIKSV